MRSVKARRIRKHTKTLLVAWLHSLLDKEEADKINVNNYMSYMPKQTHLFVAGQIRLSAFHPKWVSNKIKQLLKIYPYLEIESIDLELIKWQANRFQA
jgi:hypothetical protein|tara:strand:+ start:189 stop:482 length:294 start_codon:yes stop_codon:yes gene_type:complete